ncbi:PD40 domain-containing protein [Candidatus Babeliales bacterium]|nr:PD40 domain-containing protein [Candidatus Babeliales bacterium]
MKFFLIVLFVLSINLMHADTTIDGDGNRLTLTETGSLLIQAGQKVTLKNLILDGVQDERLIMEDGTSQLVLHDSKIILSNDYSFSQGSIEIINNSSIEGEFTFTFSGHNLLIRDTSELKIGDNTTFVCTPTGGLRTPIHFQTNTSSLLLDNAIFKNNNIDYQGNYLGLIFSNGKLVVDGTSYIQNVGSTTDQGLMLGTGPTSNGDCKLIIKPNANLIIQNAGLIYNNSGSNSFNIAGNIQTQNDANFVLATDSISLASLNFLSSSDVNLTGLNTLDINNKTLKLETPKLSGQSGIGALSSISLLTSNDYGSQARSAVWSPDGKKLAVAGISPTNGNEIQIYEFDGSSLTLLTNAQVDTGGNFYSINWSPDGKHIVIGGNNPSNGNQVQIYQFDGASLTLLTDSQVSYGTTAYSVDWSPNGRYLAVGGETPTNGNEVQVYEFNGTSTTSLGNAQVDYGTILWSLNWSPDGKYLAIGGSTPTNGNEVQVYEFDGDTLTLLTNAQINYGADGNSIVYSVNWSPDGKYLAIVGDLPSSGNEIQVYKFDGDSLTSKAQADYGISGALSVHWSYNGNYIAVGGSEPTNDNEIQVYKFDSSSLTLITNAQADYGAMIVFVNQVNWSPDDKYLAVAGTTPDNGNEIHIYSIAYDGASSTLEANNGTIALEQAVKLENIQVLTN